MEKAIDEKDLDIKIKILAKQINDAHRGDPTPVVIVCILNGGFMFFSDLVKEITNFAKLNKCKRMCIMARPGWEKVSKKWGWQKKHVQLEKWIG